jgi:hypothetical protein
MKPLIESLTHESVGNRPNSAEIDPSRFGSAHQMECMPHPAGADVSHRAWIGSTLGFNSGDHGGR